MSHVLSALGYGVNIVSRVLPSEMSGRFSVEAWPRASADYGRMDRSGGEALIHIRGEATVPWCIGDNPLGGHIVALGQDLRQPELLQDLVCSMTTFRWKGGLGGG